MTGEVYTLITPSTNKCIHTILSESLFRTTLKLIIIKLALLELIEKLLELIEKGESSKFLDLALYIELLVSPNFIFKFTIIEANIFYMMKLSEHKMFI